VSGVLDYAKPVARAPGRRVGLTSVWFGAVALILVAAGIPIYAYVVKRAPRNESWKQEGVILLSACVLLPIVGIILAGVSAFMGNKRLGWAGGLTSAFALAALLVWGPLHFSSRMLR
jgi:hypothetical protein